MKESIVHPVYPEVCGVPTRFEEEGHKVEYEYYFSSMEESQVQAWRNVERRERSFPDLQGTEPR